MSSIIKQNCLNYGVSWEAVKRSWDLLNWLFLFTFVFLSTDARLPGPGVSLTNAILLRGRGLEAIQIDIVGARLFPGFEHSGSRLYSSTRITVVTTTSWARSHFVITTRSLE